MTTTFEVTPYLNENNLGDVLYFVFGQNNVSRQVTLIGNSKKYRVDYSVKYKNTVFIVEFDGPRHYTQSSTVFRDNTLKAIIKSQYKNHIFVQIPYFVQLNDYSFGKFFGYKVYDDVLLKSNKSLVCDFPHGFIEKKIVLPCDYCLSGIDRFSAELLNSNSNIKGDGSEYWQICREIYESLYDRKEPGMQLFLEYADKHCYVDLRTFTNYPT